MTTPSNVSRLKRLKRKLSCVLIVTFGLTIYSMWADFIPTAEWKRLGVKLSFGTATMSVLIAFNTMEAGAKEKGLSFPWGRLIFGLLVVSLMLWLFQSIAITTGVGSLATLVIGEHHHENVSLLRQKGQPRERYKCPYRLVGYRINLSVSGHLCISEARYISLPDKGVPVLLDGEISSLGFHIRRFNTLTPDQVGKRTTQRELKS